MLGNVDRTNVRQKAGRSWRARVLGAPTADSRPAPNNLAKVYRLRSTKENARFQSAGDPLDRQPPDVTPSPCSRREGRGMAGPGRCQDSLPSVSDRYRACGGPRCLSGCVGDSGCAHLNQQCPRVFHFLLAMVTLLNFQLPLVCFA